MRTILLVVILTIGLVGCVNSKVDENSILEISNNIARTAAIFGYRQAKIGLTEQQMLVELEKPLMRTAD